MNNKSYNLESYFTFIKAVAITGIFSYHMYERRFGWGSVSKRFQEGILENLFGNAHTVIDYLKGIAELFFSFGSIGVELFIMASGFGLYLSYKKKNHTWKNFYVRRMLRILPLYWISLILIFSMYRIGTKSLLYHILLLQSFTPYYLDFGALWFVGYIFLLYLLFPLLVRLFNNAAAKWTAFIVSLFLTPLSLKVIHITGLKYTGGIFPTRYLPFFLFGMLISDFYYRDKESLPKAINHRSSIISLALIILVVCAISYTPWYGSLRMVLALLLFWGLYSLFLFTRPVTLLNKTIAAVAYGSYVIFLLHVAIFELVLRANMHIPVIANVISIASMNNSKVFVCEFFVAIAFLSYVIQKSYDALISGIQTRLVL
jgi:peptidoglycan/LPS O-acetylase OafA/YrhL